MSSRSRSSSRSSTNRNLTPNGRKRKLNSQTSLSKASTSQSSSKKTTSNKRSKEPDFSPSTKRRRISTQSSDCQPGPSGVNYFPSVESNSEEEEEEPEGEKHPIYLHAAMATPSPGGHLNNKTNSFRNNKTGIGAGTSNHAKKIGGSKKLVIKNRKTKPELPENYSKVAWEKLREAIVAIHTQQPISYSLEELYQAVENMCSHKLSAQLYDNLRGECHRHVESLGPVFKQPDLDLTQFLVVVDKQWTAHCRQMIMIRSIFLVLDRTYAVPNTSLLSIWDFGLELFGDLVASQSGVQARVVKGILALVHRERSNESIDRGLVKSLLRMFVDLQVYQEVFELEFLKETETMYRAESLRMIGDPEFTLPDYLSHVDRRLLQENARLLHYLHQGTRKPLILCVEKQLIGEHQKEILDKGFESLLEGSRFQDLSLLYKLYTRFKDGLSFISKAFSDYIKKSGAAIVSDTARDKTMVQDLLNLKAKVDCIIVEAFSNNERLHCVVRESFESVVNKRQNKPAELIAKFVDSQLKSGNKEWSDEELDKLLDRIMVLFRYIHGKDVFEAFYKKDLAKRLLLGKSASTDAEKSMLLKLKQECGPNFTSKLEGMFKDMELSKEMMVNYRETRQSYRGNVDLSVSVLTMGYWPPYIPMEVILPAKACKKPQLRLSGLSSKLATDNYVLHKKQLYL